MWTAIYKKLWIVVLVPLLAGGLAFFLTWKKSGQYRSAAIIEASIPDRPAAAKTLKEIQEPGEYYENVVGAMKTELVTSMVSYRLLMHDLEKEIAFRPPAIQYSDDRRVMIRKTLEKKLASFELLSETDPSEQTIYKVIHNMDYNVSRWIRDDEMTVERRDGTNEIEVACSTEDPFLSAFAANALSQEYIRYETNITQPVIVNDSIAFFREEVERLRTVLEQRTAEVNEATRTRSTVPVDDSRFRRLKANRISEYEMKVVEEQWEIDKLREQLQVVPAQQETSPTSVSSTNVSANAKIQIIRRKIDQLSKIYADGGSKDKQLDSIITKLERQVTDETARLQLASQKTTTNDKLSAITSSNDMVESRIKRHEASIQSIRNEIRKLKSMSQSATTDGSGIAQARAAQAEASREYDVALAQLKRVDINSTQPTETARASHHLILKSKALPSAKPESPWAVFIIFGSFIGSMAICIVVIAVTRPAPPPDDNIFLRVNYSAQRKMQRSAGGQS